MLKKTKTYKSWIEISRSALWHNIKVFRDAVGKNVKLVGVIKANAYGHGLIEILPLLKNKVDMLAVDSLDEASIVREYEKDVPLLILGYVPLSEIHIPIEKNISFSVYNSETLKKIASLKLKSAAKIHIKLETGLNRQGVQRKNLSKFINILNKNKESFIVEGAYTHYANIEDTLDPSFAMKQLGEFKKSIKAIKSLGVNPPLIHTTASAGTLLYPKTHFSMVRIGFGLYGWWMSLETRVSLLSMKKNLSLRPVLTWKSIVAQIKEIEPGESVGYGQTWFASRKTKIAIIPVGYADGLDRKLSNIGRVIINGCHANIIGRVSMNMIVVDVTDIKKVMLEDEVALLGNKDGLKVSADEIAKKLGTINYEVVARINPLLPRIVVK